MSLINTVAQTKLGLKGETPKVREDALKTSQLHAQGPFPPGSIKSNASTLDRDGLTPTDTYRGNAPEGASF